MTDVVLLTPITGQDLAFLCDNLRRCSSVKVVEDLPALYAAECESNTVLIGYGTGVIVPGAILSRFTQAYNFHAASPDYPGREAHHFAVYDGAHEFGATAHVMAERLNAGEIVGIERFRIPDKCVPARLLTLANEAMGRLFVKLAPAMITAEPLPSIAGEEWGSRKTSRRDIERMCELSPLIGANEFNRRFAAFDGGAYDNLTIPLNGYTFRIDKSTKSKSHVDSAYSEFTEYGYKAMLRQAKDAGYKFAKYGTEPENKHVLWRHDLDLSVHRGLRLAEIEVDENVRSTWFVNPHSSFYNINEKSVQDRLHRIVSMGHWIGLHFDADFYANVTWTDAVLTDKLRVEAEMVQSACGASVDAVSWHNPDVNGLLAVTDTRAAGMINCYSADIQARYQYVSDSNGYWRFKSIPTVLQEEHERIQVLTHPGWWTPEPMAPRDRIERCLLGRARSVAETYDAELAFHGRRNLGREDLS